MIRKSVNEVKPFEAGVTAAETGRDKDPVTVETAAAVDHKRWRAEHARMWRGDASV